MCLALLVLVPFEVPFFLDQVSVSMWMPVEKLRARVKNGLVRWRSSLARPELPHMYRMLRRMKRVAMANTKQLCTERTNDHVSRQAGR